VADGLYYIADEAPDQAGRCHGALGSWVSKGQILSGEALHDGHNGHAEEDGGHRHRALTAALDASTSPVQASSPLEAQFVKAAIC
jgi:hypothetical protein